MPKTKRILRKITTQDPITFWKWLVVGSGGKPGFKKIINRWLPIHLFIGTLLSVFITNSPEKIANSVLLPLIGVFVGLSFAWAGTIYPILQSRAFDRFSSKSKGGHIDYLYTFQCAVLIMLVTLVSWGLVAVGFFESVCTRHPSLCFTLNAYLYSLVSISIRECWHVVLGVQMMIIIQKGIDGARK